MPTSLPPSSAEELRKHLTELNAYRVGDAEDSSLAYDDGGEIFFSAVTMSRSFDWGIDACRPVLDRAQIMTGTCGFIGPSPV